MTTPFDLNFRHLRAVDAIVRYGSVSAAAEAMGLSQPALTHGLTKLEAQFGVRLFDRLPLGMAATPEGRIVAERAVAMFAHLAAAFRGAARPVGGRERLMTAAQARAFLAIAEAGSFTDAGHAIGLSQPTVHRAVRDLEQIADAPLIERRSRGVALTQAGGRMARAIRLAHAEIAAALTDVRAQDGGRIAIGAMPLSRAMLVPQAVRRLLAERRDVEVTIVEGSWAELIEPLRDGVLDMMIGALRAETAGLAQTPLIADQPVVVAGARHPVVGRRAVGIAELAGYPWIVAQPGAPLRSHWEGLFAGMTLPRRPIECGSVMTIRELLADGAFLTLLSPAQIALEVGIGVLAHVDAVLPSTPAARTIGLVTRSDWRPTTAQRQLVAMLHAVASNSRHSQTE